MTEIKGEYATGGTFFFFFSFLFFEDVPLVEFIYCVFTCTPGGVTVGVSGLCCCVPCLSSVIISVYLLILLRRSRPTSVSDYNNPPQGQHVNVCMCVLIC